MKKHPPGGFLVAPRSSDLKVSFGKLVEPHDAVDIEGVAGNVQHHEFSLPGSQRRMGHSFPFSR